MPTPASDFLALRTAPAMAIAATVKDVRVQGHVDSQFGNSRPTGGVNRRLAGLLGKRPRPHFLAMTGTNGEKHAQQHRQGCAERGIADAFRLSPSLRARCFTSSR